MAKKKLQTRPYDAAAYLKTEQDCALYLQAAIDESDGDAPARRAASPWSTDATPVVNAAPRARSSPTITLRVG